MNINPSHMKRAAAEACDLLKAIANPHRLIILCQLVDGEKSVGQLAEFLGIRDSTVSQNLALMRRSGMVEARRDAQTMWYSIKSPEVRMMLETLYSIYCSKQPLCRPRKTSAPAKRKSR